MPAHEKAGAAEASIASVPQTSLANPAKHPDEVEVRFRRFTLHGNTAYQKGQFAGFLSRHAEDMAKRGAVDLPPGYRPRHIDTMITK